MYYKVSYFEKDSRGSIIPAERDYPFLFLARWFARKVNGKIYQCK